MATKIYSIEKITLVDDTEVWITPLKIKFLRQFMDKFDEVKTQSFDDKEAMGGLTECAFIAMKQYYPGIMTLSEFEDLVDMPTVYKIIDVAGGIKIRESNEESNIKEQTKSEGGSWDTLDLAKLEAEIFLLGIWKDYDELESSLSMPELIETLQHQRERDYQEKKFSAAIQGVDLDKQTGKSEENAWEKLKAKVFSGGKTSDPNDITSFQGQKAAKAGFGVGMGLGYEDLTKN
jgi:hypothetical protein